jgi:hypothetical protein
MQNDTAASFQAKHGNQQQPQTTTLLPFSTPHSACQSSAQLGQLHGKSPQLWAAAPAT